MPGYSTERIRRAIVMAADAHKDQKRKEKGIPFISHPLGVAIRLALNPNMDEDVIVAAILHDTLEDTKLSPKKILKAFGENVVRIVFASTEPDKRLAWKTRKQHTIETIKKANLQIKLVACADKLDNLQSIQDAIKAEGKIKIPEDVPTAKVWGSFREGYEQQKRYYQEVAKALFANIAYDDLPIIFGKYMRLVEKLFGEQVIFDKKARANVRRRNKPRKTV